MKSQLIGEQFAAGVTPKTGPYLYRAGRCGGREAEGVVVGVGGEGNLLALACDVIAV